MNKTGVIILSTLLILFLVALSCGLYFTMVTPDVQKVTDKYLKAGYKLAYWDFGDYSIRTFTNSESGEKILIIWYGNDELANKSIYTANKAKGKRFAVKRGNAVAIGYEEDMRIFQFA